MIQDDPFRGDLNNRCNDRESGYARDTGTTYTEELARIPCIRGPPTRPDWNVDKVVQGKRLRKLGKEMTDCIVKSVKSE